MLVAHPHPPVLPLIALIIITVLNDGTIISIAYDNVRPSLRPEVWNLPRLYTISLTLGTVALASSLLWLDLMLSSHSPDSVWRNWRVSLIFVRPRIIFFSQP